MGTNRWCTLFLGGAAALCAGACTDSGGAKDATPTAADSAATLDSAADSAAAETTAADSAVVETTVPDATDTLDTLDTLDAVDTAETDTTPPPVTVTRPHWRVTFYDDFRGKPADGGPEADYCFDALKPQCQIWSSGNTHDCDLADVGGNGFYPPTKANLVAAIKLVDGTARDYDAMSEADVKTLYGQLLRERWAPLDKCNWTSYEMVNWMATDYAGHWSARFDPIQVLVDPTAKGTLLLSASYAPVAQNCIFGGQGGDPNCQLHGFAAGELTVGVSYSVDPNPTAPGVYYPASGATCPNGGTLVGARCQVYAFPPHVLETTGVTYWVDTDPRWPGVYYANQTYACRDNIDYAPDLAFRNLTCPILDGGLMSYAFDNHAYDDGQGTSHKRGIMQYQGRFEAKARIPKGLGAFPATWLMPEKGGWPYDGGEIDVLEARDNADEVYQTYHHGKCYDPASGLEMDASDSADCDKKGGKSTHLAKGYTTKERTVDEFWKRDHVFWAEWSDDQLIYGINNVPIGTIKVGTVGTIDEGAPAALAPFESSNFPTSPFYWILNHSTYVRPDKVATFITETFRIDYIRNYVRCGSDNAEYCPDGGVFQENLGCVVGGHVRPSVCAPIDLSCPNGGQLQGTGAGARCLVHAITDGSLRSDVTYFVDPDPRWPGVYYAKIGGGCPYGGTAGGAGAAACLVAAIPADELESGLDYSVSATASTPGIYYTADFRN